MRGCRPLTDTEVTELAETLNQGRFGLRDRALFMLGVYTGFRVSELLSLRIRDVSKMPSRITVQRRSMKGGKAGRTSGRTVLFHPNAKQAVADWLELLAQWGRHSPHWPLFQSKRGPETALSRTQAWRVLRAAFDELGLDGKLGTHAMRKTYANRIYGHLLEQQAAGQPVDAFRMTSKALGHKNIDSTDKYLSFREEHIDAAILAMSF